VTSPSDRREFNAKTYRIAGLFTAVLAVICIIVAITAKIWFSLVLAVIWIVISVMAFRAAQRSPR